MDFGTKRKEVQAWLQEVFGSDPVPEFEVNEYTIGKLHELSVIHREKKHRAQIVIDDLEQKTAEYNAEAQRLSSVLSHAGLSIDSLSQAGKNNVRMLANLASSLDIKDPSETSYFLAMQALDDELEEVMEKNRVEAQRLKELKEKSQKGLLKCSSLNKVLETMEKEEVQSQTDIEKKKNDTGFFVSKAKGYRKDTAKLQKQLVEAKADRSIFHDTLVKKYEALKSIQQRLEPLQRELQTYANLPPDLTETKIKIEQQKRELAVLERKVSECIDVSLL